MRGRQQRQSQSGIMEPKMSIKLTLKVFSGVALVFLVFLALGPESWQPRSGFGWELDHFVGYFVFTVLFCLAWPRPVLVGGALIPFAMVLEALQAFTPDRSTNIMAALYGAAGVLVAALLFALFMRVRPRVQQVIFN